ncbi:MULTISPECIES: hypothetical protein [Streptomyces]|uniref:hypothetical protein n=1 Tax=Streptomyces TaxID=1883 RepID=UPI00311AC034
MRLRRWSVDRLLERPSGRVLVVFPFALIVVITVVDVHSRRMSTWARYSSSHRP